MDRVYLKDTSQTAPSAPASAGGYPTVGDPSTGTPATTPGAYWFYAVTEEIRNAIVALGGTPSKDSVTQLGERIVAKITDEATARANAISAEATARANAISDERSYSDNSFVKFSQQTWLTNEQKAQARVNIGINNVIAGSVLAYSGDFVPEGYLLCDGSAISRTTYATLFGVFGTMYGGGDGSTTFNLPNLTDDRFIIGRQHPGPYIDAGLPNIEGSIYTISFSDGTGAFINDAYGARDFSLTNYSHDFDYCRIAFSAANSNSIYGNSQTVMPKSLGMRFIVKY